VATEFLADHVSSLRFAREVDAAFKNELLPVFGKRSIGAISDAEIARLLKGIAKDRPYQARHIFAYLSKFFRWAIAQRSYGLKISPCTGLSAKDLFGKPSPRTRIPSDSELAALWLATAGLSYPAWPFVRLLLLTGQRLWRFHDLRRTMRTGLSALRIADTVSELCIAHTQKGVTQGLRPAFLLGRKAPRVRALGRSALVDR
jgi:hypothetical protein